MRRCCSTAIGPNKANTHVNRSIVVKGNIRNSHCKTHGTCSICTGEMSRASQIPAANVAQAAFMALSCLAHTASHEQQSRSEKAHRCALTVQVRVLQNQMMSLEADVSDLELTWRTFQRSTTASRLQKAGTSAITPPPVFDTTWWPAYGTPFGCCVS